MEYRYKVINEEMIVSEGILEAVDTFAAKRIIRDNGWQLISLTEAKSNYSFLNKKIMNGVKYESISAFCSQMAMMIRSGANLVRGLEILQTQTEDKRLKEVLEILVKGVSRGDSLSQAMRSCQGALPELLINLVAVGEESGGLDSVFISMAEYYERENFIRKKVMSASIYPTILTAVLIVLIGVFLNFILPEITDLLSQNEQQLPAFTQMVIDSSFFLQSNGLSLVLIFILLGVALYKLFQYPSYRFHLDTFILGIPLLGKNLKNVILARFCRTLALLLHSSIPIVPILNFIESIVGNEVPRLALTRIRERIIQGETLALAFRQEEFFDPMVIQMMSIGEETGRLEELMYDLANHYDKRVEIGISKMIALVEPVFTLIIGIFAGGLIVSMALPIFNMANGVK